MRLLKVSMVIMLSVGIMFGCSSESGSDQAETQENAQKIQKQFEQERDEFISNQQDRLDSLETRLNEVGKNIQETSGETERKLEQSWSNIKKQIETIRQNVEKLEDASRDRWEKLKSTAQDQMEYLESQISDLKQEIDSK